MTTNFKPGNRVIVTSITNKGTEKRAAIINQVTESRVYFSPDWSETVLERTGQGSFDPANLMKTKFGLCWNVEVR